MLGRREFLVSSAVLASAVLGLSSEASAGVSSQRVRPRVLSPGDAVGIVTPATSITDPGDTEVALRALRYFGLSPTVAANVGKRFRTYREFVEMRADDLHAMFSDPSIKGIFCARGGYGAQDLLDRLDYGLIRSNPKVFVGFSDITALHLAIHKRTGLVTFHGPTLTSLSPGYTERAFRRALFERTPLGPVGNPDEPSQLRLTHPLRSIRPGVARGDLVGGNLTLVCSSLGTAYEIDCKGKILFLEDAFEEPYRIARMLQQMKYAGKLADAAGVIFGECKSCNSSDYKPSFSSPFTLGEVVDFSFGDLKCPVLYGFTIGHTDDRLTLPFGVEAVLDADKGILDITESAFA